MSHVLLVDDDATLRRVLAREVAAFGHRVDAAAHGEEALRMFADEPAELALVDLRMPGMSGQELLEELLRRDPTLAVVVLTGHGAVPEAVAAMRAGAADFLTKPVALDDLERALVRALDRRRLTVENLRLRRIAGFDGAEPGSILGVAPATELLRATTDRLAAAEAHVLVLGENGTGKELVARRLHAGSARRTGPFVVAHAGAIPEDLVESELFGHVKGAFTGAESRRIGLFEAADGGTLFLDEVGELPLRIQPALLRAVQFGEVRPVGSERTATVDVRVVAATHRDLRGAIAEGGFREDLFHRLAQLELRVPALRERPEDVPLLADAFLAQESRRVGRPLSFDEGARRALARRSWPGNVRELQNVVTRLAVLSESAEIRAADVERHPESGSRPDSVEGLPTLDLHELEQLALVEAMRRHGGRKPKAAAELGIALKTLYNKLARLPEELRESLE